MIGVRQNGFATRYGKLFLPKSWPSSKRGYRLLCLREMEFAATDADAKNEG